MHYNPYSTEIRYTLDLLGMEASRRRPSSIRIATTCPQMAKAMARRLGGAAAQVVVDAPEIAAVLDSDLGLSVEVRTGAAGPADVALFPFALEQSSRPRGEPTIIAGCYNRLSYKTVIRPREVQATIFTRLRQLKPGYRVRPVAALYSPRFLFWWTLTSLLGRTDSARYFRLEEQAMRYLIDFGPLWRISYIVVLVGDRRG